MTHGAPAFVQDKPALPMLDEVLDLAPALEVNWPAEAEAIPPGTLVNRAEPGAAPAEPAAGDQPAGDEPKDDPVEPGQSPEGEEESFIDSFDLDSVPPEARPHVEALQREWQGQYTQKRMAERQEVEEAQRTAEQTQALIEGLRDPNTMPHYLQLLGVDLTDPETLRRFGLEIEDEELLDGLDEPDPDARISQLEQQLAQQKEADEQAATLQALDSFADQELEGIEEQWGRKLTEEEDVILRHQAESNPGPDGLPDYASAAKMLKGILSRYAEEELKRRSEPGRSQPGGKPGGKALDVNKPEERAAVGLAAAERALASQND